MGNTGKSFSAGSSRLKTPLYDSTNRQRERGNAVVYVLIVVALFAALSFVLSRQSGTSESGTLETERISVQANQIIQVSNQVKQGVDQLIWSGTAISDLDFVRPSDAGFATGSHIDKVFHPEGGGLVMPRIPANSGAGETDPATGWYLDRFNNIEWTPTAADDVMLTAYGITEPVCAEINRLLTGAETIPTAGDSREKLVESSYHTGSNSDFAIADCASCEGYPALCVSDAGGTIWSYYNIIAGQ